MLILTRRLNEKVIIDDHLVEVTVLGVKGCQVRLGIEANKAISIHREEIFNKIQDEKAQHEKNI